MRKVLLDAVVHSVDAHVVLDTVTQWERYIELTPHVRVATIHSGRTSIAGESSWELYFRSGLLQWSERERYLHDELRIEFEQIDGDFDEFAGFWTLEQDGPDCVLHFECDFDFGIPSLEGILDPIAERVIKETVAWAVVGMFDKVSLGGDLELLAEQDAGLAGTT